MPSIQHEIMQQLYGKNIWADFVPGQSQEVVEGWNGIHPSLTRLASIPGRKCVVDIGVWKGQSTITLANAMKAHEIDGCVISVDTFLGSIEHHDSLNELRINGRPRLFEVFMTNVYENGVSDYVVPFPQTSITASAILKQRGILADIVHVDAAHEYREVLADCEAFWPIVKPGGYMIGDDYVQGWWGVVKAAGEFSSQLCLPLTIEFPKWILQKPL